MPASSAKEPLPTRDSPLRNCRRVQRGISISSWHSEFALASAGSSRFALNPCGGAICRPGGRLHAPVEVVRVGSREMDSSVRFDEHWPKPRQVTGRIVQGLASHDPWVMACETLNYRSEEHTSELQS